MRDKGRHLLFGLVSLAGLFFDQITKAVVFKQLPHRGQSLEILPGIFRLRPWTQTGMAWGLFGGHNLVLGIISAMAIIIVIAIFFRYAPRLDSATTFALALIIGGASGNLCDRLFVGEVRDFLDFYLIHWPIFNIADALICAGVALAIFSMLRENKLWRE